MAETAVFPASKLDAFVPAYPEKAVRFTHGLHSHPLLSIESLTELALSMRPIDVEYNKANLPVGVDPDAVPDNGLDIAKTIQTIATNESWMVLKFIEQNDSYRHFLRELLSEIEPFVREVTGEMLKPEGFIFLSAPGAVTPFHMDPEHNILLQIKGSKTMTVFPADDENLASGEAHEAFHRGGHRNLEWRDDFANRGKAFELAPGNAIYVPVKAPHWVKNGPAPSLSLSITWQSEWAYHEQYARAMNAVLRRFGMTPAAPQRFPHQNRAKSLAWRAINKARGAAGSTS